MSSIGSGKTDKNNWGIHVSLMHASVIKVYTSSWVYHAWHHMTKYLNRTTQKIIICLIYSNNLFFPALALIGRPEGLERTGSSILIIFLLASAEFFFLNFAAEIFLFPFPLFFSSFGRKSSIVFDLKLDMDWRGRLKITQRVRGSRWKRRSGRYRMYNVSW